MIIHCSSPILGEEVVFLDPHVTQNFTDLDDEEQFDDSSYHPETCWRINFQSMDPSLALVMPLLMQSAWIFLFQNYYIFSAFPVRHALSGRICFNAFRSWAKQTRSRVSLKSVTSGKPNGSLQQLYLLMDSWTKQSLWVYFLSYRYFFKFNSLF